MSHNENPCTNRNDRSVVMSLGVGMDDRVEPMGWKLEPFVQKKALEEGSSEKLSPVHTTSSNLSLNRIQKATGLSAYDDFSSSRDINTT